MQHNLFYDSLWYIFLFGLGGAVNTGEEEDYGVTYSLNQSFPYIFVEHYLALPGSTNYSVVLNNIGSANLNIH